MNHKIPKCNMCENKMRDKVFPIRFQTLYHEWKASYCSENCREKALIISRIVGDGKL